MHIINIAWPLYSANDDYNLATCFYHNYGVCNKTTIDTTWLIPKVVLPVCWLTLIIYGVFLINRLNTKVCKTISNCLTSLYFFISSSNHLNKMDSGFLVTLQAVLWFLSSNSFAAFLKRGILNSTWEVYSVLWILRRRISTFLSQHFSTFYFPSVEVILSKLMWFRLLFLTVRTYLAHM